MSCSCTIPIFSINPINAFISSRVTGFQFWYRDLWPSVIFWIAWWAYLFVLLARNWKMYKLKISWNSSIGVRLGVHEECKPGVGLKIRDGGRLSLSTKKEILSPSFFYCYYTCILTTVYFVPLFFLFLLFLTLRFRLSFSIAPAHHHPIHFRFQQS